MPFKNQTKSPVLRRFHILTSVLWSENLTKSLCFGCFRCLYTNFWMFQMSKNQSHKSDKKMFRYSGVWNSDPSCNPFFWIVPVIHFLDCVWNPFLQHLHPETDYKRFETICDKSFLGAVLDLAVFIIQIFYFYLMQCIKTLFCSLIF